MRTALQVHIIISIYTKLCKKNVFLLVLDSFVLVSLSVISGLAPLLLCCQNSTRLFSLSCCNFQLGSNKKQVDKHKYAILCSASLSYIHQAGISLLLRGRKTNDTNLFFVLFIPRKVLKKVCEAASCFKIMCNCNFHI